MKDIIEWRGTVSLFSGVTSKQAKELPVSWHELVALLETPKILPDKGQGELFSGTAFTGGKRRKNQAKASCLLMLDYDHAPAMDDTLPVWDAWSYLAYTTWSHGTEEKGHAYRVIIPLAEPIPAAHYPALWQWADKQSGGKIDAACKDISRIMYLPACPDDRKDRFQFQQHESAVLDWRSLPLPDLTQQKPDTATTGRAMAKQAYIDKALADAVRKIATAGDGGRNNTLNREAYTLGQLVAADWNALTRGAAERTLLAAATTAGLPEKECLDTIKSGLDAGAEKPRANPDSTRQSPIDRGESGIQTVSEDEPGKASQAADTAEPETKIPHKFALKNGGLMYGEPDENTGEIEHKYKVCGHLEVVADTVDGRGANGGRLLKFKTRRGQWREFVIPMGMLFKDLGELAAQLAGRGLRIENHPKTKQRLAEYLNDCEPQDILTTTESTGWHGKVFVLTGGEVIGTGEKIIFTGADTNIYQAKGTLAAWQSGVAALAVGNSRLEFAVSLSFVGVLMPLVGDNGGIAAPGVNFFGNQEKEISSSTGKTTTLRVAASTWGSHTPGGFVFKWDASGPGLETRAVERNHTIFCIDELGGGDARRVGKDVYMFSSGEQRARGRLGTSGIEAAKSKTWCAPFLSTAEITLQAHMEKAGEVLQAGQSVRCLDIPANADAGLGVFENLHGLLEQHGGNKKAAGAAFSDLLTENTLKYHGTAGRAFVAALLKFGGRNVLAFISERRRDFNANVPADASSLARRAAKLFSLTAAAGELAAHLNILPWEPGAAMAAARRCFDDWMAENDGGNAAERQAMAQVAYFLESNRENFRGWHESDASNGGRIIPRQVGYLSEDENVYFVYPQIFKRDACKGYSPDFVLRTLEKRGALLCNRDKRYEIKKPGCRYAYGVAAEKVTGETGETGESESNQLNILDNTFPRSVPGASPVAELSPVVPGGPPAVPGPKASSGAGFPGFPGFPGQKTLREKYFQVFKDGKPTHPPREDIEMARDDAVSMIGGKSWRDIAYRLPPGIEVREINGESAA